MTQSQSPKEALKALVRGLAPDALGSRAILMVECMAAIDQLGVPAEPTERQLIALIVENDGFMLPAQQEAVLNRGREAYARFIAAAPKEPT